MSAPEKKTLGQEMAEELNALTDDTLDDLPPGAGPDPKLMAQPDENALPDDEQIVTEETDANVETQDDAELTELRHRAIAIGFDAGDVESFDAKQLDSAIAAFDRRMASIGKQQQQAPQPQPEQKAPEPKPEPKETTPIPSFEISKELEDDFPDVAKAMKEMNGYWQKQFAQLRDTQSQYAEPVKKLLAETQARSMETVFNEFDNFVAKLPSEYETILGKGPTGKLDAKSEAGQRRQEILAEANNIALGYIRSGVEKPPLSELFRRAAAFVCSDKLKELARAEAAKKIEGRRKQMTPRPASRTVASSRAATNGELDDDEKLLALSGLPD